MPFKIVGQDRGFKVCDKKRCYSKKPLTKKQAQKQRVAIALSESRRTGKSIDKFFV